MRDSNVKGDLLVAASIVTWLATIFAMYAAWTNGATFLPLIGLLVVGGVPAIALASAAYRTL